MAKQGQTLELKLAQKLSPLQIQTIKLLELPIQEFEQRVRAELEDNPVVEEDTSKEKDETTEEKDISIDEYKDDDIPSYKLSVNNYGKDARPEYNTFSVREGFTQNLMEQLGFQDIDDHLKAVAAFVIGSLDASGYLRRDISSVVDDLAFRAGISSDEDEVLEALKIIQGFDPAGVGARNLQECLLLQLRTKNQTPDIINATAIVSDCFKDFSDRHFQKVMTKLGLSPQEMKRAMSKISKLNPLPGGQLDDSYNDQAQQIVPDFKLRYEDGRLNMTMPRFSIPELRINKKYLEMIDSASSPREKKDAEAFVKRKYDQAKWFIEAVRQRHNTLEKTMQAIIDFQHDYFIDGDESNLKPMVLKDIAERTGFDISTISRVVNSKYIDTHFGVMSLKYFFSEGLENKDGEEISTRELKKVLKDCVDNEDKHSPLTDDELVGILGEKGYKVARRTIAKYRDQLGIPKARLRKEI